MDWQWFIGLAITVLIALAGLWWRVERQQSNEIAKLRDANIDAHQKIRSELHESTANVRKLVLAAKDDLTTQHLQLRDKIQQIWEHLSKKN